MPSECIHQWGDPYRSKHPNYSNLLFRDCKGCGAVYYNDEMGVTPSGIMHPMVRLSLYSTPPDPAMPDAKMFPLQAGYRDAKSAPHPLQIPWSVAEKAYCAYARRYGRRQSLERLAERGGFDGAEMDDLYPSWRDEVSELTTLRQRLAEAEADLKQMSHHADAWKEAFDREWKRAEKAHADAARWEGAAGVLARYVYENGRGCGTRTATERDDDLKIHRGNLAANPTASALVREGGGGA